MPGGLTLAVIVVVIVAGTVLVSEAAIRIVRSFRGIDEGAVMRRLSRAAEQRQTAQVDLLQPGREPPRLRDVFVPFYEAMTRFLAQSGAPMSLNTATAVAVCLSAAAALLLLLVLPERIIYLAIPAGVLTGGGGVFFYISRLRARRISAFEEQLPDAIELIVRSLRVGHPLSVAISSVANELPDPIGIEFTMANNKITYGLSIPEALQEMFGRVPLADLGFLVVAVQIQEEAGGNLVESLAKLANVIRDRFRMFRKAKAMTAEGRFSAWLLSIFPFAIGLAISVIRPGYYDKISQTSHFVPLAIMTVVLLVMNIVVMSIVTKLKV